MPAGPQLTAGPSLPSPKVERADSPTDSDSSGESVPVSPQAHQSFRSASPPRTQPLSTINSAPTPPFQVNESHLFESQTLSRLLPFQQPATSYDDRRGLPATSVFGGARPAEVSGHPLVRPIVPLQEGNTSSEAAMSSTMWYSSHAGAPPTEAPKPSGTPAEYSTLFDIDRSGQEKTAGVRQYDRHQPNESRVPFAADDMSKSLLQDGSGAPPAPSTVHSSFIDA